MILWEVLTSGAVITVACGGIICLFDFGGSILSNLRAIAGTNQDNLFSLPLFRCIIQPGHYFRVRRDASINLTEHRTITRTYTARHYLQDAKKVWHNLIKSG